MSISIKRTYFYGCVRISAYKFHILVVCIVTINAKEYMHLNTPSSVMAVWEEKTQSKTVESAIKMVQIDLKSIIFKKLFSGSKILMADRELWNCRTFISTRRSYFMEVCWCCISQKPRRNLCPVFVLAVVLYFSFILALLNTLFQLRVVCAW